MATLPANADREAIEDYSLFADSIASLVSLTYNWSDAVSILKKDEIKALRRDMARTLARLLQEGLPNIDATELFTIHGCGPFSVLGISGPSCHAAMYQLWTVVWTAAKGLGGERKIDWLIAAAEGLRRLHPNAVDALEKVSATLEYEKTKALSAVPDAKTLPITQVLANTTTTKAVKRGRQKADYETAKSEAELAVRWEQARDAGTYKGDFSRDENMKIADLDRLLDRVAARKRASE